MTGVVEDECDEPDVLVIDGRVYEIARYVPEAGFVVVRDVETCQIRYVDWFTVRIWNPAASGAAILESLGRLLLGSKAEKQPKVPDDVCDEPFTY